VPPVTAPSLGVLALALAAASPWVVGPLVTMWRVRRSRDLREEAGTLPPNAPVVSVIVPARNERTNIGTCVRSILAGEYPRIELVIVDDRSTDGTADAARAASAGDERVRIIENPELPAGWFGKPWACTTGAANARGEMLCFTDADARHGPRLVSRAMAAMAARQLDMLSVAGHQELASFWERVVQPQVFWMIASRYGGTDAINGSARAEDKIANGQCIFVRRSAYESIGGHEAVHDRVAEDLALAQRLFAAGKRTELILGHEDLTTRMYTSLREIMAGWRKNVFAGGREAMPWGALGQFIFPALLLVFPVLTALPPIVLTAALLIGAPPWLLLAAIGAVVAEVATWVAVYRWMRAPVAYALLFPLGALVFVVIALQAIARGSRVEWKGRAYVTTSHAPRTSR
jgi:glycosyltransferase involved in cell wall biosynthesis